MTIVQIAFRNEGEAKKWFREARTKGALPAGAGLRPLSLGDIRATDYSESRLRIAATSSVEVNWLVPPT